MSNEKSIVVHSLPLVQAVHQAVKHVPGGVGTVSGALGLNSNVLQNQLNPTQHHKIDLDVLIDIISYTKSPLILDAIGEAANCTWVDRGQFDQVGDMAMLDTITKLVMSVGDLSRNVHNSLSDGVVDDDELASLEHDLSRLISAGHAVIERAKQLQAK